MNTAARLADAAAVGAVYAGAAPRRPPAIASWRALRPLRLKGKREPVEAYELLGLLDAPGTRSGLGDEAPFVGREAEIGRVAGRLAEVVDRGEPRVLVFTAEAGLGKSRFAAEVERFAAGYAPGAGYAPAAGSPPAAAPGCSRCAAPRIGERRRLGPLADLVRAAIGLPTTCHGADPTGGRGAAAPAGPADRQGRPGTKPPRSPSTCCWRCSATPSRRGRRPRRWIAPGGDAEDAELEATSRRRSPTCSPGSPRRPRWVIVVDDLHDATPETVDALGRPLSRLTGPVLVLLLGRPELVRTAGALTRVADAEVLPLPPLRGADAARLLTAYLEGGRLPQPDDGPAARHRPGQPVLPGRAGHLLMERGALTSRSPARCQRGTPRRRGGWPPARWAAGCSPATSPPCSPPGSTRCPRTPARCCATPPSSATRCPPAALEALRDAAGRAGRPAAVAAVELERAVDELLQRRMLRRIRGGFAFATPLLREAAYAGVGKADLAERHAALARWAARLAPAPLGGPPSVSSVSGASVLGAVATGGHAIAPAPTLTGLGMSLDAFVAEHAERAATLADAVGLRPDRRPARSRRSASPRSAGPPAALAPGSRRRRRRYAERAAALAGGVLPPTDRLVHARALLQLGRVAEALAYAEKIAPTPATTRRSGPARCCSPAGPPRRRRPAPGVPAVAGGAGGGHRRPGCPASGPRRCAGSAWPTSSPGGWPRPSSRFAEAYQIALADGDRRSAGLVAAEPGLGDHHPGRLRRRRRGARPGRPALRRARRPGRAGLAARHHRVRPAARRPAGRGAAAGAGRSCRSASGSARRGRSAPCARSTRSPPPSCGELAEADREARRAYRDFAEAEDDWGRGLALVVRGVVARGLGEYRHADDLLTDATAYAEQTGHPLLLRHGRHDARLRRLDLGDPVAAEEDARAVLAGWPHTTCSTRPRSGRGRCWPGPAGPGRPGGGAATLEPVIAAPDAPSVLFPAATGWPPTRRRCSPRAHQDAASTRAGQPPAGEDIRSRVYAARVLAGRWRQRARDEEAGIADAAFGRPTARSRFRAGRGGWVRDIL